MYLPRPWDSAAAAIDEEVSALVYRRLDEVVDPLLRLRGDDRTQVSCSLVTFN